MHKGIGGAVFLTLLVFFVSTDSVFAQGLADVCNGPDCNTCHVIDLGNRLISWLIGLLAILFAVLIVIAGYRLVTSGGNQQVLDAAKSQLTNALIGFVIVLAAWLIVDTVVRTLVGNTGEVSGSFAWSEVECFGQADNAGLPTEQLQGDQLAKNPFDERFSLTFALGPAQSCATVDGSCDALIDACQGQGVLEEGPSGGATVTCFAESGVNVGEGAACNTSVMRTIPFMGHSVTLHEQAIPSAQRINEAWERGGRRYTVNSIGSYSCRNIAGSSRASYHSLGMAIDINYAPRETSPNPHCPRWTPPCGGQNVLITDMPVWFRDLFKRNGWGWGGEWRSSKDAMHFSAGRGEGGFIDAAR